MEPRDGPFDDPPIHSQSAPMRRVAFSSDWSDAALAQRLPMWFRIVAAVALHAFGTTARASAFATEGGNRFDQRNQLSHIIRIGTGQDGRQRKALRIRNEVVLAARFRPISGVGTCFFPPRKARTEALSTMARDQSI